jgi:hypothetical protein
MVLYVSTNKRWNGRNGKWKDKNGKIGGEKIDVVDLLPELIVNAITVSGHLLPRGIITNIRTAGNRNSHKFRISTYTTRIFNYVLVFITCPARFVILPFRHCVGVRIYIFNLE